MAEKVVGVPTMGGISDSFKDFGIGAIAGLVYLIASRLFGGLAILAAPILVGAMIKGDRGKIIAVIAGFMLLAGIGTMSQASSATTTTEVY